MLKGFCSPVLPSLLLQSGSDTEALAGRAYKARERKAFKALFSNFGVSCVFLGIVNMQNKIRDK